MYSNQTAEQLYTKCEGDRHTYLDRARTCSKLTLPYVMPEDGFGTHSRLETPFQGIGARGSITSHLNYYLPYFLRMPRFSVLI